MKTKYLLTGLFILSLATIGMSQRGPYHNDRYNNHYTYGQYSGGDYNYNNYHRYRRHQRHMTPRDRKRLNRLIYKLEDRKRCAWEDGYLSGRDINRIQEVERDIDLLIRRYDRRGRNYNGNYRSRRNRCR